MLIAVPGVIVDGTSPATAVPTRTDINVYVGVDTTIQVTITGSNGSPINILGYTGTLTIKDRIMPNQGASRVAGTAGAQTYPGTVINPGAGIMTFTIPGSFLKALELKSYYWDVFTTNVSGGRDEPIPFGLMTVNQALGA